MVITAIGMGTEEAGMVAMAGIRVYPVTRTQLSLPQRMHLSPRPVGFEGALLKIAKYLSVVVARGSMCLQFVHSAKWKSRGPLGWDSDGFAGGCCGWSFGVGAGVCWVGAVGFAAAGDSDIIL